MRHSYHIPLTGLACAIVLLCLFSARPADAQSISEGAKLMAPDVMQGIIDFLATLCLALFALVGYFWKDGLVKGCWHYVQMLAGLSFLLSSVISLLYAYWGRIELMRQLAGGTFDYETLAYYVTQAWSLLIAAIAALAFIIIGVNRK